MAFLRRPPRSAEASPSWLRRVVGNLALRTILSTPRTAARTASGGRQSSTTAQLRPLIGSFTIMGYSPGMLEAPKQDWSFYLSRCQDEHLQWLRALTPSKSLDLFRDLYRFASSWGLEPEERDRLEAMRLSEKIKSRDHLRAAFEALDRLRDGRPNSANPR